VNKLPSSAKVYIVATLLLGIGASAHGLALLHSDVLPRFIWYLLISLLMSGLKVALPGITGTMSVNFLCVLLSIAELNLGEAMLLSCACAFGQSVWKTKYKPRLVHVVFSISSVAAAVYVSYTFYHSPVAAYLTAGANIIVLLPLTATVYFICNTLPVASVIALSDRKQLLPLWEQSHFWFLPYYLAGASIICGLHWVNGKIGWQFSFLVLPVFYVVFRSYRLFVGRLESQKQHAQEVGKLHLRTIQALAMAIEAKDQTTHDHLQRVQVYAVEIGKELHLSFEEIESLRPAALLHDIGKLAVPEHIISKPGKLTAEEFEKMKIHPLVGAEILEQVEFPYPVAPIVKSHHEKWDGTGYPEGLIGEAIPIGARILAAVDCLDALASDRQYRRAVPLDEAMGIVIAESGKAFDPKVIAVLQRRFRDLEKLAQAVPSIPHKRFTNTKVARCPAPASGLETTNETPSASPPEPNFLARIGDARQEAQMLFEMAQELGNSLSLQETLSLLAVRLQRIVPYDAIAIYEQRNEHLFPVHVAGTGSALFRSLEIPVGEGLSGWVAHNNKPIINGNPSVEPGYLADPTKFSTMRSALSVPLEGVNGVTGVLTLYRTPPDAFSRDNLRILLAISTKVGISLENALKYTQLENTATTDFLTGLPNARALFGTLDAQLSRCERNHETLTVLVCDLDGFKQVNDRFGHLEGDRILQEFAKGVRKDLRQSDCIARMGGDEFVLILPGLDAQARDYMIARLNRVAIDVGKTLPEGHSLSVSVGASEYPLDSKDAEALLTHADRGMYTMKQNQQTNFGHLPETGEGSDLAALHRKVRNSKSTAPSADIPEESTMSDASGWFGPPRKTRPWCGRTTGTSTF
jgi:diguanylate cyclase (GGDEF)-like protein/putative nucleotidyltransferase with HDIG domain